jgi:hypothetical protein
MIDVMNQSRKEDRKLHQSVQADTKGTAVDDIAGREENDPLLGWYEGEIWFFDNYVIPLACKLETRCQVPTVIQEKRPA